LCYDCRQCAVNELQISKNISHEDGYNTGWRLSVVADCAVSGNIQRGRNEFSYNVGNVAKSNTATAEVFSRPFIIADAGACTIGPSWRYESASC